MSEIFCTECGSKNEGHNQFCVDCGALLPKVEGLPISESPINAEGQQGIETDSDSSESKFKLSKSKGLVVLAVLLSFILGVALTAQNVFSGVIGDRYTEKQLKSEKEQSYESGYSAGESAGYSAGESAGYSAGYKKGEADGYDKGYNRGEAVGLIDGCNNVFDKVDSDQLIAIFYPYRTSNLGKYYYTRDDTC